MGCVSSEEFEALVPMHQSVEECLAEPSVPMKPKTKELQVAYNPEDEATPMDKNISTFHKTQQIQISKCKSWDDVFQCIKQIVLTDETRGEETVLFDKKLFLSLFETYQHCYKKTSQKSQFHHNVLELVRLFLSERNNFDHITYESMGEILSKWDTEVFFNTKSMLQLLKYIAISKSGPNGKEKPFYDHFFQQLNFDFTFDEALKCTSTIRYLANINLSVFAFVPIYLQRSILNLEFMVEDNKDNKTDAMRSKCKEVEAQLLRILKQLQINYPASTAKGQDHRPIKGLDDLKCSGQKVAIQVTKGNPDNLKLLTDFIVERAKNAKADYEEFENLVKPICTKNGYAFKSGVKVRDQKSTSAILRVMEKLFDEDISKLKPYTFDDFFENNQTNGSNQQSFGETIKQYVSKEEQIAKGKLQNIINTKQEIEFTVSDMVRGKCMFKTIDDVIQTVQKLIEEIHLRGYSVKGVKNRLKKHTKDFMFKIQLKHSVAQLQLALSFDSVSNEFNHKIYELLRSSLYSPITNLFIHKEKWSKQFFDMVMPVVQEQAVNETQKDLFDESICYSDIVGDVKSFMKNFDISLSANASNESIEQETQVQNFKKKLIEIPSKVQEVKQETLVLSKQKQDYAKFLSKTKVALVLKEMGKNELALQTLSEYQKVSQLDERGDKEGIHRRLRHLFLEGQILKKLNKYQESLRVYKKAEQMIVENDLKDDPNYFVALNSISSVYQKLSNFQKSLEYSERALKEMEQKGQTQTMAYANQIQNRSLVYGYISAYDKSLECLRVSREIKVKLVGKQSVHYSDNLNNTGMLYFKMGKFKEAIEYVKESSSIIEKTYGKDSLVYAYRLNNIAMALKNLGDLEIALQYYEMTLSIKIKLTGKESADTAIAYNNIAALLEAQGQYGQAFDYYKKVLNIKKKLQQEETLDYAQVLYNVAKLLETIGYYDNAIGLYYDSYKIQKKILGQESKETAQVLLNIGFVFQMQGKFQDALDTMINTLNCKIEVFGKDHIECGYVNFNIAMCLKLMGRFEEAKQYMLRSNELYVLNKGPNDPGVLQTQQFIDEFEAEIQKGKPQNLDQRAGGQREETKPIEQENSKQGEEKEQRAQTASAGLAQSPQSQVKATNQDQFAGQEVKLESQNKIAAGFKAKIEQKAAQQVAKRTKTQEKQQRQ